MTWNARLRVIGLAAALLMALWAAAQAQERAALSLAEAGSDRLVVAWTWQGDEPDTFAVHWRQRVSGAEWASVEIAESARRYAITGLRPLSAYIVRVRPLDAEGNRIRALNGRSLDLRGVFDTIQLPVPDAPRVVFDGERATAAWDAVEGATGYELAWGLAGGEAATERLGADVLEFATGALAAGSRYEFRLRSLHQRDRSAPSATATLTTAAWPHAAPRARFEFHRAAGMLVEWDAVAGAEDYVVAWQKEGDDSRAGETAATGTSALVTREGGFFTGAWLFRIRAANAGLWSETARVWVDSPAPELRFSLESSRDLCTEGTLTEIRWRGGGGAGNLWPHVNGRMIGANTYRIKVNCGLIPRTENGEIDESQRDAVITGFLRDGRGTIKSASIRVPRAEALPAPTIDHKWASTDTVSVRWLSAAVHDDSATTLVTQRYMLPGDIQWTYTPINSGPARTSVRLSTTRPVPAGGLVRIQGAELRNPIEIETPSALQWSETAEYQVMGEPYSLSVQSTHDTATISWIPVPSTELVRINGCDDVAVARGPGRGESVAFARAVPGQRSQVLLSGLSPDTEYEIVVIACSAVYGYSVRTTIRTDAAPADWSPLPRGPQNVRATATQSTITVQWDEPFAGAVPVYQMLLSDGNTGQGLAIEGLYEKPAGGWSYTFRALSPGTLYRIKIRHHGLVYGHQDVLVETTPIPVGSSP